MSRLEGMEKQGGPSDAELVSRALEATTLADRKAAYAAIADRHHLAVLRQCAHWFPSRIEAEDVSQTTFEEAFRLLATDKGPPVPDKLIGWLIEIARRRGLRYRSLQARGAGPGRAHLADDQSFDMFEDDQDPRSGSATRLAHVNRLVDTVVATLNGRQQRIYQLRYAEELTGRQVAQRLGIANSTASNAIGEVEKLITNGFGALMLLQEGRAYCPRLALIIENVSAAAATPAFTAELRQRIVRHFDDCDICDHCQTCNAKRRELAGPLVPALIPILYSAELRERIHEFIDRIAGNSGQNSRNHPGSGLPAAEDAAASMTAAEAAASYSVHPQTGRPNPARRAGPQVRRAFRRWPVASAAAVVIVAAGAGISADILTSGGAAASHSSHGSQPDVFTVDDRNQPLNAGTLKVENEVLADARHHDRAALGRLIDATNPNDPKVIAQNQVLDQPGAYAQIVTLLTKTHGAAQDAQIMWPGFLLAGTGSPLDAADARSLGVTSTPNGDANYKGISVNIQVEAYSQSGYQLSPKLDGIFQTNP